VLSEQLWCDDPFTQGTSFTEILQLTNCIQHKKPVDEFPGEQGWMGEAATSENAANRLTIISMDLPAIRTRFEDLQQSQPGEATVAEAQSLLEATRMMDTNLQTWALTLPSSWNYRTVSVVPEIVGEIYLAEAWPGPQHAYDDVFISSIINDYRVSRIFCQRVIIGCLSFLGKLEGTGDAEVDEAFMNSRFVIQQMVGDICASVPFCTQSEMQPKMKSFGQDEFGKCPDVLFWWS
jgi:hypothetical protein